MSDPIDELIEWLDKAIKHHEAELESDTVKGSDTLYQHYYGVRSGLQLARNRALHYKKLKENEKHYHEATEHKSLRINPTSTRFP